MSGCASSKPSPIARKDDVIKLVHRISKGESGKTEFPWSSLKARAIKRRMTWAMLDIKRCKRNCTNQSVGESEAAEKGDPTFWILSKSLLPSSTALTIDEKSSSARTISDASLATSLPALPMAIPTSAR